MRNHFLFILIICCCCIVACNDNPATERTAPVSREAVYGLDAKAASLKRYIDKDQKYNDRIALLIDMKIHSGKHRFFVYDLVDNKILDKGLVTHGSGSVTESGKLHFKNIPNSLATSLGTYSIGYSYNGTFGKAYKMHGLEASNDKAFERFIVFHSHECVPDEETRHSICLSFGCPTVSPAFFERVARYLDSSSKPVLMQIFYGTEQR